MLCKVIRKEKVNGTDFRPGTFMDLAPAEAAQLAAQGVVRPIEQQKMTNLGGAVPDNAFALIKK